MLFNNVRNDDGTITITKDGEELAVLEVGNQREADLLVNHLRNPWIIEEGYSSAPVDAAKPNGYTYLLDAAGMVIAAVRTPTVAQAVLVELNRGLSKA